MNSWVTYLLLDMWDFFYRLFTCCISLNVVLCVLYKRSVNPDELLWNKVECIYRIYTAYTVAILCNVCACVWCNIIVNVTEGESGLGEFRGRIKVLFLLKRCRNGILKRKSEGQSWSCPCSFNVSSVCMCNGLLIYTNSNFTPKILPCSGWTVLTKTICSVFF